MPAQYVCPFNVIQSQGNPLKWTRESFLPQFQNSFRAAPCPFFGWNALSMSLAWALYPLFGGKKGRNICHNDSVTVGRITFLSKSSSTRTLLHMNILCWEIVLVTTSTCHSSHVLFTNYFYDRLICHASGLSWQAIRACQIKNHVGNFHSSILSYFLPYI